jgi:hypothetical protein
VNPANGDFYLLTDSPCIDTGDPGTSNVPWGGSRIDMGAYEFDQGWYLTENGTIVHKPSIEQLIQEGTNSILPYE